MTLNLLCRARLSDQSRFFIAFDLTTKLRPPTNAAILGTNLRALDVAHMGKTGWCVCSTRCRPIESKIIKLEQQISMKNNAIYLLGVSRNTPIQMASPRCVN